MYNSLYGDIICLFGLQAEVSLRNLFFCSLASLDFFGVYAYIGFWEEVVSLPTKLFQKNSSTLGISCLMVYTELSAHRYKICFT